MTDSTFGRAPSGGGAMTRIAASKATQVVLDYGIYVALIGFITWFAIASPFFLTTRNLVNIGSAVALSGLVAAGMTVALIAGVVDLSVGAVIAITSVLIGYLSVSLGLPMGLAVMIALGSAVPVAVINYLLVIRIGINSIVATLATATVVRAIAFIIAGGTQIVLPENGLTDVFMARPFDVPLPLILMSVVYVAGYVLLTYARFGWHIYAVGGNTSAATRVGIPVGRVLFVCFVVTSVLAALSGAITTITFGYAHPVFGAGAEIDILTAVLLGGIGLNGGGGRIERTLAGILLIGVVNNGLTLVGVDAYYQQVVRGIMLVLAVVLDSIREKRLSR